MLSTIGSFTARISRQVVPNPFIFAIVLSVVVYLLGIALTDSGPFEMVQHWYGGFWNLLEFSMQMVVILLFGYVLASSPPVRRAISWAARWPKSAGQGVVLVTVIATAFGFLSWGLGLIAGAMSAREVAKQGRQRGIVMHYPLLAAAGFSGLIIFNNGMSASAPLLVSTGDHFLQKEIGTVPISQTILTPSNLIVFFVFLAVIPLVYRAMHPRPENCEQVSVELLDPSDRPSTGSGDRGEPDRPPGAGRGDPHAAENVQRATAVGTKVELREEPTFAERLENAAPLTWIAVVAGFSYIIYHFATQGFALDLNLVNFILLMLGLVAYKTPIAYVRAVDEGIRACGQIVLQFPFYAGIMGMMASSGLVVVFADALVSISNQYTFPLAAMGSAAIVNLFVPSAGGQWAVQGPLLIEAAQSLNFDVGRTIIAFGYGDQLTNALQPMWMLPLLGVTALKARDILGYTAVMMVVAGTIFALGVAVLPLWLG